MKKNSVEAAHKQIELLRNSVTEFRNSSFKYPEGDSFRNIYSSLASIFESHQFGIEFILLLEDARIPRPFSRCLNSAIESIKREFDYELIDQHHEKEVRTRDGNLIPTIRRTRRKT